MWVQQFHFFLLVCVLSYRDREKPLQWAMYILSITYFYDSFGCTFAYHRALPCWPSTYCPSIWSLLERSFVFFLSFHRSTCLWKNKFQCLLLLGWSFSLSETKLWRDLWLKRTSRRPWWEEESHAVLRIDSEKNRKAVTDMIIVNIVCVSVCVCVDMQ